MLCIISEYNKNDSYMAFYQILFMFIIFSKFSNIFINFINFIVVENFLIDISQYIDIFIRKMKVSFLPSSHNSS